jgi:hypothetical protein
MEIAKGNFGVKHSPIVSRLVILFLATAIEVPTVYRDRRDFAPKSTWVRYPIVCLSLYYYNHKLSIVSWLGYHEVLSVVFLLLLT